MSLVALESNGLVEGNCHGSSPNIVATKPPESSAKDVDSISIDLADTSNEVKLGDCKHFSIRGYVSEVRKKDWKKCWPFPLDNDAATSDENIRLPPLEVPNFRWWRCQNCLNDSEGLLIADGSFFTKSDKPKSGFCTHMSSHNLLLEQLMTSQQASSIKMIELAKVDAGSFVDKIRNPHYHSLHDDTRSTKSEKANIPVIGHAVGSQNQRKKRTPVFNCTAAVPPGIQQQTDRKGQKEVAFRKKRNGSLEIPNLDLINVRKADTTYEDPNATLHSAAETLETVKEKSNHGELTDLLCRAHKESRTVSRVSGGLRDSRSNHPPLEIEENYDMSETAEILHGTPPGGLHRRRTRKVKLLTELLGKSVDDKTPPAKEHDSSSRALSERPEGEISALAPRVLVGVQRDPISSSVQHSEKRKLTPEEWNSLNTSSMSKKARTLNFKRDGEDSDARINSSFEEAFARAGSYTRMGNHLIGFKIDGGPTIVKKKKKKINGVTRHMPQTALQENVEQESSTRAGDAVTNGLFKLEDTAISGKTLNAFPSLQKPEKSLSVKKKGKILEHGLMYPDLLNNSMGKEGLTSRKDKERKQIKSSSVPHISTEDISTGKSSLLSFNNCLHAQRYDKKLGTSTRDDPPLLSWRTSNDFQHYVGHRRFPSTSERGVHASGGVPADSNHRRANYVAPWPKEKLMPPALAEAGSHSMVHQLDDCGPSNNCRPVEIPECLALARKYSPTNNSRPGEIPECLALARRYNRQGVDLIAEPGASDDIPMEIVELMAKHQFERCLPDAETDKQFTEAKSNNRSGHRLDLNRAYRNEVLSPLQEEIYHNTKPANNARTGNATGVDSMTSTKLKPVDCVPCPDINLYDMRQSEHIFGHKVFKPFPHFIEMQQNGVQYSGKSSSRHTSPENGQWIRKTVDRKSQCSHKNMLPQKPINTYPTTPQCKEGTQFWPAMIPNNFPMPFPFTVVPTRSAEHPISEQAPSYSHGFNIKGNMHEADRHLSFKSSKHERKADSNALRKMQADPKVACKHSNSDIFELSQNDVVPAMHLLSLMDPRIRSDVPVNIDGNHKFFNKPPFVHDHLSKDLPPPPSSGYEVIDGMKHPSYDNYGSGKKLMLENMGERSPVIPMFRTSASSQHDKSFKAANVRGDVLSKHQGKGKKYLDSGMQNIGLGKRKSASSNFGSDTTCGSVPAHTMPKLVLGTKGLMSVPMQFHAVGDANTQSVTGHAMSSAFLPPKGSASEICSINRNPSDFTEPGPGNPYMIRGEDLIPICAFYSDIAPFSTKLAALKHQKKHSAAKEQSRYQTQ